jgi:hypothetical protein
MEESERGIEYLNYNKIVLAPGLNSSISEKALQSYPKGTNQILEGYMKTGRLLSGLFMKKMHITTIAILCTSLVFAQVKDYKVGDRRPAGGLIFYDKGSLSDGWRYLEATPNDQTTKIQSWNGNHMDIKTSTSIGSGRDKTNAIIAAQGSGSYTATICKNLNIGGFSDWFLSSKDELGLIYTNIKKAGLGGFVEGWLWSSSQDCNYGAW